VNPAPGEEIYREAPRSYWSLLWVVAVFAVGVVIDAVLGGAAAHAIGWLLFTAIATGLWAVVIHAVRSEKSLVVTADELRVGDEVILRADVVAFAPALDDEELPVLGWPRGKPRQLRGVTVRLAGGQDVVVPTRHGERLRGILGLAESAAPERTQDVRAAAKSDLPHLAEIAERAGALYRVAGFDVPPVEASGAVVFVAGRPPIGFVRIAERAGAARIEELAVVPKWMRQGIGSRLLERAVEWARRRELESLEVVTRADVPWNAPFFAARGFVEVGPGEGPSAVLMRRELGRSSDAPGG
jgi:N-acetylglutamate synthase-like GNAT family acetyltransferase